MRVHLPYLTQDAGRHRAVPAVYVRTNADDLTGQRRAVAAIPAGIRAQLHEQDARREQIRRISQRRAEIIRHRAYAPPMD